MSIYLIVQNNDGNKKVITAFSDYTKAQIYQDKWNNPSSVDRRYSILRDMPPVEIEQI